MNSISRKTLLICGGAVAALTCTTTAWAQSRSFNVPSEDAVNSIPEFARQAGIQIVAPADQLEGLKTVPVQGNLDLNVALSELLQGTRLQVASNDGQTIVLRSARKNALAAPQTEGAAPIRLAAGDADPVEAPASGAGSETVVVTGTGSLIKGIQATGSNMISIDADAMKQAGALTTDQILEQVPQLSNAFNVNVAAPTATNFSGFRPQLRSLPSENIVGGAATLLLLDGNNMVGVSGLGTAPDASIIPTVVLRRVDVLPDGASATYGANAMTGVINFITRDTFDGLQLSADLGIADSYTSFNASAIGGTSWEGGNAYLAIQHEDNTVLMGADRAYTKMDLTAMGGRDSRGTACPLPNITAGTKNYAQTGYPSGSPGSLVANVTGPYGPLSAATNAGSLNRCDTNANTSIFPADSQTGIFGSFRQKIADGVEFSTKVLWNTRLQYSLGPAPSATVTVTNSNPYFQSIAGETSQKVQFSFAPYLGANELRANNSVEVYQITPQLTAQLPFGDWEMTLLGNYARSSTNTFNANGLNTALLNSAVASPVGGQYVDPYNISLTNSALLTELLTFQSGGTAIQRILQSQVTFDGTLFGLPGGPVKAAIGGKYDWESFYSTLNVGITPGQPYLGSLRVVKSGFAEVHVPLVGEANRLPFVYSLQVDVSGRIDDYSVLGSTNNFKLGLSYQPFEELTFRATRGTSYDAPSLADTTPNQGHYTYTIFNTPNAIVPPGTSLADSLRPSIGVAGGNPDLMPELGSTWSLGADFRPTQHFGLDFTGLDLSATVYHLTIEHQIGLLVNSLQVFEVPNYSNLYILNPTLAQVSSYGLTILAGFPGTTVASAYGPGLSPPYILYDNRRNNLGNAILSGVDFSGNYTSDIGIGTLTAGFSGTVSTKNATAGNAAGPFVSIQSVSVPQYAMSGFAQLITGRFNLRTSVQFTPGFRVDPTTQAYTLYGQKRIASFTTVNAHVGYDLSSITSWTSNTELGLTVNNLFDRNPPIYLSGGTDLPANGGVGIVGNGSTLGRYFLISLQKTM